MKIVFEIDTFSNKASQQTRIEKYCNYYFEKLIIFLNIILYVLIFSSGGFQIHKFRKIIGIGRIIKTNYINFHQPEVLIKEMDFLKSEIESDIFNYFF